MSLLTKMKYSFTSKGMDKETFTVVSFKGFEAISKPYKFEILLVSDKTDVDPLTVLQNPAIFTIHRDEEDNVDFNGILMQFEETQEFNGYFFFKAVLTPKLWWLSLTHHNQVFLDLSAPDIMEHALKDGGLNSGIDFSFNLMKDYQPIEYVCQYDESHFNFVSRWAEREGMYYFFEQTPNGEKVIFTDSKMEHKDLLLGKDLIYLPQSGLDATHTKEVIQNFLCKHNMLPQKVFLKDYNYLKPSFSIEGIADVDENGRGENYIYGVHFDSPEEGNRLAQIRAEALICRKSVFHGESSVPYMVPGYTFDLNDHYKKVYNRKYLVSEVTHEGHQTGYLVSGLTPAVEPRDEQMFYSNTFTAIYSNEQFRA
ncbi:MAG: type VI secretion system tip protein VgrG, partial [Desulfobacteraceae bacterium]|nr:type VI secretion system tip protein VgrG [Desulfobacteraceae bacterium]